MATQMRNWIMAGLLGLLVACGGGGGGDRAAGVEPGPESPGQPVPPDPIPPAPVPVPYAEAEELRAFITNVTLPDDGRAVIDFQLADGNNTAITDLTKDDVRFIIAKLQTSPLGNMTGSWQSYVNRVADPDPDEGPGTEPRLQSTYEGVRNTDDGEFTNNGDGTYRYRMVLNVNDLDEEVLSQAETEGLDLSYDPSLVHRVGMQFDNAQDYVNPTYDWVPQTGATDGLMSMDIAATDNCNGCHDPLRIHGRRVEVQYCVMCHNPGSTDASSTNTVDMKVMIHKIHMGAELPSVQAGGEYIVGGHDYSGLHYPQDIRNCTTCHAGTGTVGDREDITVTSQGDNWAQVPSAPVCGSCHDDKLLPGEHIDRHLEDDCSSCHSEAGYAGRIEDSHRMLATEAREMFQAEVLGVSNSMPGQTPKVTYRISNADGENYDLINDPVFAGASINIRMSWDTRDYTNTGNGAEDASSVATSALSGVTDNGDGTYTATMPIAIPDGSEAPGIAASGSGVAVIEGRLSVELEEGEDAERVALTNVHAFFSIDEADGDATARRQSVELANCLSCHGSLSLHGDNRTDNIDSCVTCHNPRNTDREVREIAANPPTDGKDEEALHFKTMIHGIHAAGIRENPLQVVGFQGRNTYVYDEDTVHFPGDLSNCTACHTDDGFTLPLASSALGTTVDTGDDHEDPTDDTVITPVTAACSSCHDDTVAKSHMTSNGGNFSTTQAAIDDGEVVEECAVCHGEGRNADVAEVHNPR